MKKNKKGFTLVEIMVVLLLIGIIILIAIPSINAVRRSIKERELSTKKDVLISAAETYAENNQSLFPKEGGIIQIPVRTLVYYGYVNSDDARKNCNETIGCVMNPVDDSSMNDDIITIKKVKSVTQATWDTVDAYLVTFKANGSTSVGGVTNQVSIGCDTFTNVTCTIKVPTIERDGFEKLGFNTNANASTSSVSVGSRLEVNSSNSGTNYYAITKKDVTVTFYPNNGTFTNGESSIAKSCTIRNTATNCSVASQEPSVSRIGYNKKTGWYSTSTSTTTVDISKVANSTSAYAQWNANTYTVKYDKNNTKATGTTADSSHVYDTAKNLTENGYSLTGYRYNGWNTRADGKGTSYANKQSVTNLTSTNGGTVTLYAQWSTNTYSVTFDVNGGNAWTSSTCGSGYTFTSSGAKCTKSVTYDSTYGSMPTPTRAGYSFAGWYTSASGGTKVETGTSVAITSDQTLYAHWTAYKLTLKYHVNGGTIATGTGTTRWRTNSSFVERSTNSGSTWSVVTSEINTETTECDLWNVGTYGATKTGYKINGTSAYNTSADGTGVDINQDNSTSSTTNAVTVSRLNGGALTADKTINIYIKWVPETYTVTFDVNGGNAWTSSTCANPYTFTSSGSKCTKSVTYDSTYGSMPSPTRSGYSFQGWYTSASGGTKVETSTGVSITSAQTLYAHWKEDCSQGGTYNSSTKKCEYSAAIVKTYCIKNAKIDGYSGRCYCCDTGAAHSCQYHNITYSSTYSCVTWGNNSGVNCSKGTLAAIYKCTFPDDFSDTSKSGSHCYGAVADTSCPSDWELNVELGTSGHDYGCNYDTHTLSGTTCSYTP